jgi:glycosyltransferase involved in cell wall biosynthesis
MAEEDRPAGPVTAGGTGPSISVFFPCYNEQDNVTRVIEQALSVLEDLGADYEVIIVDDGSADRTGPLSDEIAMRHERVRVVHHPRNLGYGAALRSGFEAATKEWVFYTDGDGQFDIGEMPAMLPLMEKYDIVSGCRKRRRDNLVRTLGGWLWTRINCMVFSLHVDDMDCAFKLYRRAIFDNIRLESTGALIDTEILARAVRKGYKIGQYAVSHYPRAAGKQTGGSPRVVFRAFRELIQLRRRILSDE